MSTDGSTKTSHLLEGPSSAKLPRVENGGSTFSHVRSYSTGSLSSVSQSIGSRLGSVTGYALDALSGFLESPSSASAATVDSTPASVSASSFDASTISCTSSLSQFHNLPVPKDPFLSPLHADDEMLAKLPPVSLVVSFVSFSVLNFVSILHYIRFFSGLPFRSTFG